jgi:hypothetical protein
MTRHFRRFCVLGMLIGVLVEPQSTLAQTIAVGPYYATPSWDQTIPAASRFVLLSNFNSQAVLDRETGLVWQRSPVLIAGSGEQSFDYLTGWSLCLHVSGGTPRLGWRLPSSSEFSTLLDPTLAGGLPPTPNIIPTPNPFNIPNTASDFWTSTVFPGLGHVIGGIDGSFGADFDSAHHSVLCVRGGASTDNP